MRQQKGRRWEDTDRLKKYREKTTALLSSPSLSLFLSLSLPQLQWAAINPHKTKKKNYKNSGTVYLEKFKVLICVHALQSRQLHPICL